MELAKVFLIAPNAPSAQKELDKLKSEVERLGLENNQLRRHAEMLAAQATARSVAPMTVPGNPSSVQSAPPAKAPAPPPAPVRPSVTPASLPIPAASAKSAKPAAPTARTHTIKQGDIPATIAKQHGVKLEVLLAANPNLDPKRMKIGQAVIIPAP